MDERNDGEKTRVISANASSFSDTISHELEQKRAVGFNGPFFCCTNYCLQLKTAVLLKILLDFRPQILYL